MSVVTTKEEIEALVQVLAPRVAAQPLLLASAVHAITIDQTPLYSVMRDLVTIEARFEQQEFLLLQKRLVMNVKESNELQAQSVQTQTRVADAVAPDFGKLIASANKPGRSS